MANARCSSRETLPVSSFALFTSWYRRYGGHGTKIRSTRSTQALHTTKVHSRVARWMREHILCIHSLPLPRSFVRQHSLRSKSSPSSTDRRTSRSTQRESYRSDRVG